MASPKPDFRIDLGLYPEQVPLGELLEMLRSILDVTSTDDSEGKQVVSLLRINRGSTVLPFKATQPERARADLAAAAAAINRCDLSDLPPKKRVAVQKFVSWSSNRASKVRIYAEPSGRASAVITANTRLATPAVIKGATTLYGEVRRAGGARPSVQLVTPSQDQPVPCYGNHDVVRQLASRLYTEVGLSGVATWNTANWRIEQLEISSVLDFEPTGLTHAFDELAQAAPGAWAGVTDADQVARQLRSEE
jgi:hypothetical protein